MGHITLFVLLLGGSANSVLVEHVCVDTIISITGAGTNSVNGIYTAYDTGHSTPDFGSKIQFKQQTQKDDDSRHTIVWYPKTHSWPAAWYIDLGFSGIYYHRSGDQNHFPIGLEWEVYTGYSSIPGSEPPPRTLWIKARNARPSAQPNPVVNL